MMNLKKLYYLSLFILGMGVIYAEGMSQDPLAKLLPDERNNIQIFAEHSSSVVYVSNMRTRRLWGQRMSQVPAGTGSGFVWDSKGHIVTNYHVVSNGDGLLIHFKDDPKSYEAKLIGASPRKDIAVLKLVNPPKNINPVEIGKSSQLIVGMKAVAIGNPFGLDYTMTTGIISALGRSIDGVGGVEIRDVIQTDASINPGNSGGPLLNSAGELIGMNTAIYSPNGTSAGVGFAVPVDAIADIVPQLIKYGHEVRPTLGIKVAPETYLHRFGYKKGVMIAEVLSGGPAEEAQLQGVQMNRQRQYLPGDVLLSIEGNEVNNLNDIYHTLSEFKIGDVINMKYIRGKKLYEVKLKLGSNI
ncbi:MAG: trypsin-like peptidase domain-containing protein [Lentisphaeria bacterium]|nr:trypsin-like peptidase domain-containing protein [Lentisphaeria bacterium]